MAGPRDVPLVPTMAPSGIHQETVVLNDAATWTLDQRTRTTAAGKSSVRYSLSIKAEPILNNLRGVDLGAGPAQAILELIQKQHRAITEVAKPATILRRAVAARQMAGVSLDPRRRRGATVTASDVTTRRYTGGKLGRMDPNPGSVRVGIDSGRLLAGWFLRQNPAEGTYTINVPANRLDPSTFGGGLGALQRWVERLVTLIPALTGKGVLEDDGFVRAVGKSHPVQVLKNGVGWSWNDVGKIGNAALGVLRSGGLF